MNEKLIALAKKLKALADRGEGGEKTNAQTMLSDFITKHNISLEDIEGEEKREYSFVVKDEQIQFFRQIIANVVGDGCMIYTLQKEPKKGEKHFYITLTTSEYIEVQTKFDFYWADLEKQTELFYRAYVQKNSLYAKMDENEDLPELTKEQIEELWRIKQMMGGIKASTPLKRIGS